MYFVRSESTGVNPFPHIHIHPGIVIPLEPGTVLTSNKSFVLCVILAPMIARFSDIRIYDDIK